MLFKESMIAKRAFAFSLAVIKMTKSLEKSYENVVLIKQILRSATSIGANIEEALGGNSRKEFIHCMNISKKEARETLYWLKLLLEINSRVSENIRTPLKENQEIINILTKIVKTSSAYGVKL